MRISVDDAVKLGLLNKLEVFLNGENVTQRGVLEADEKEGWIEVYTNPLAGKTERLTGTVEVRLKR